jgi:hypothetical protein
MIVNLQVLEQLRRVRAGLATYQGVLLSSVGWRAMGCTGALAIGLAVPGAIGKTALCFASIAAIACQMSISALSRTKLTMDLIELAELTATQSDGDQEGVWDQIGRAAQELARSDRADRVA